MGRHHEAVTRELIEAIVGGTFAEGDPLPSIETLRTQLGAGRDVIRQALRALEERGLIAVQAGRGQTVRSREDWDIRAPDVLRAWIDRGPDRELLAETIDARGMIECLAARRACELAEEADFDLLRSRLTAMRRALEPGACRTLGTDDPFVASEIQFHRTLVTLSANRMLANFVEPAHTMLAQLRHVRAPERDGAALLHHQRILEGLSSRDPALADAAIAGYARQLTRWLARGRRSPRV